MKRRYIHSEEWYPVYELHARQQYASLETAPPTQISEEFYAEYKAALKEFNRVQRKLSRLYDKQHAAAVQLDPPWRRHADAQ